MWLVDSPLHIGIELNIKELVQAEIDKKTNLESVNELFFTPLHTATYHGHVKFVESLVAAGVNVNAKDKDGQTPMHILAYMPTPLRDETKIAEMLLQNGSILESKDNEGNTPLHKAVEFGEVSMTNLLIRQGANVNATNEEGWTPLHFAAKYNEALITRILIYNGAFITARDKLGKKPADVANSRWFIPEQVSVE